MADFSSDVAQEEWVPRSHKIGAYGTLSRGAHKKAQLFQQLAEEEAEEVAAYQGRPDVNSTYVEVAIITCKDVRDGQRVAALLTDVNENRPAEAFNGLWCVSPGDGVNKSVYMYIAVGSTTSFVDAQQYMGEFTIGDGGINSQLRKYIRSWVSSVFCHKGSDAFVKKIEEANKIRCFQRDLVQNSAYAIEYGHNSVKRLVEKIGSDFVIRYQRVGTETEDELLAFENSMGDAFGSAHRRTDMPVWRMNSRGQAGVEECTTPLAFTLLHDETHMDLLIFDQASLLQQDPAVAPVKENVHLMVGPGAKSTGIKDATFCHSQVF